MPCAIVIGKKEELEFGKVKNIYVDENIVIFQFTPMITDSYIHHFHAYALVSPSTERDYLIRHKDLLDFHPYGLYVSSSQSHSGKEFVIPRSNVYI